jgi:hypothetical protein
MRDDVFYVENQADPLAHRRAIVERHAARLIYIYPQDRGFSPRHFGMNKFHAFARYNTLYDLAYTRIEFQLSISNAKRRRDKTIKKVGEGPTSNVKAIIAGRVD